ncbi:MAG: NAD(+) synthase [Gammaproteobacteria bacterium]|nr:NAD(+) synthase [Gammaproteobacteria bacterium]
MTAKEIKLSKNLSITIAQLNFLVGDIAGNSKKIINYAKKARDNEQANLIIFPELALTGYPPEDLLLRNNFHKNIQQEIEKILNSVTGIYILFGYPEKVEDKLYNSALLIYNGKIITNYRKQHLPNYGVFDEHRYFVEGDTPTIVEINGVKTAIAICEDLWYQKVLEQAQENDVKLVLSLNASPFDMRKGESRKSLLETKAKSHNLTIVYANCIGGQDELVFDGGSMVINENGELISHLNFFKEELKTINFSINPQKLIAKTEPFTAPTIEKQIYDALTLGIQDYVNKNGFNKVLIGLSGGIDSALTLALIVDALGANRVEAISMPSRYTKNMSIEDAEIEARAFGVKFSCISIEPIFKIVGATLCGRPCLDSRLRGNDAKMPEDDPSSLREPEDDCAINNLSELTQQNIQARCRGLLLMALANEKNALVISTSNKSETAVGYTTLYGDMVGGFAALKDLPKTWVYKLASYRNQISAVIPERVIARAPSAELAEDQLDQHSLPVYDILDRILELYVEQNKSISEIITIENFDKEEVNKVIKLVHRNEYKRRQAPPGVKITTCAFGRERRYPITCAYIDD